MRAVIVISLMTVAGCAQTFDAARLGVPATMASPAEAPPVGNQFNLRQHSVFLLWGAFRISEPSLQKALAAQLGGGKGIANLRIKVRSRFGDVLVSALTLGLLVPRTVEFQGVVVDK